MKSKGKDQYTFRVVCNNCGRKSTSTIDVGIKRPEFIKCSLCKCEERTLTLDKNY